MKFALNSAGVLAALVFTTAMALSSSVAAQAATAAEAKSSAPAPGLLERTKKATKKAAHATAEAISDTGKAIDAKVPRTEAYKKKHPKKAPASAAN
ncbi:hypothetical protein [Rhodoferax sp.]|uniref:hypothetical protein n=1 Tax=Rhodoferax sp. TaxID=50421 RepID=UPI00284761A6|nr:hypothetical protein [Rhodoferax sp.]MDR3371700.1 hypothetical protein [Rhodoferax sp.]